MAGASTLFYAVPGRLAGFQFGLAFPALSVSASS
jgi:hypothetical protein